MLRSVFGKALWDRRVSLLWWLLGVAIVMVWIVAFYPALRDSPELQDFIDQFPPEALALFGIDPATYQTGFGYLQAQLYSFLGPVLIVAFAATVGSSATAAEEEKGTLDLLLAAPLTRTRVMLEKFAALALQAAAVVAVMAAILVVADPILDLDLSTWGIVGINLGLLLLGLVFGALAMLIGAWRGARAAAAGVVIGVALVAFLVDSFAPLVDGLEGLQTLTPFYWYQAGDPLLRGPTARHLLLGIAVVVITTAAVAVFRRANIGARRPVASFHFRAPTGTPDTATRRRGTAAPNSLFTKMLWDRRTSFWWWLAAIGGTAALTIAFWPTIASGGDSMQGLMEAIPAELLAMFGITDAAALLTPEGFLSARLYSSLGTTLMLVFTIASGTRAIAGEEADGTLDLLMGLPVRRSRVVIDRSLGLVTLVALLTVMLTAVVVIGAAVVDMGLSTAHVAAANVGLGLLALFFGTVALALGAWTGRPGVSTGVAAAIAVGAFLLNGLGAAVDGLEPFRVLSPFYWYLRDSPPLARGLTASYWLLIGGTVIFSGAAISGFRRRDVAV